jgi:prepilin-type processing-associated H-X9-DG protein
VWGAFPDGGYSGGYNFSYTDGHAKYDKLTVGVDPVQGAGPDGLYGGAFLNAKLHPSVATNGVCPDNYSSWVVGF